jgi:hypothetical protein
MSPELPSTAENLYPDSVCTTSREIGTRGDIGMTVWLIVFLLADGSQAEASSLWQPSKYECERFRHTLESDAAARGWTTRCLAWNIPADLSLDRPTEVGAAPAVAPDTQVLRRLRELKDRTDALDSSLDQVGSTTTNTEITVRDIERSLKRLETALQSLASRPCYR